MSDLCLEPFFLFFFFIMTTFSFTHSFLVQTCTFLTPWPYHIVTLSTLLFSTEFKIVHKSRLSLLFLKTSINTDPFTVALWVKGSKSRETRSQISFINLITLTLNWKKNLLGSLSNDYQTIIKYKLTNASGSRSKLS